MNEFANARTPVHLWIVAVLATLWNAVGAYDYVATQFQIESYMSQFTPEQLAYFNGFPSWYVAVWATAIWSSVLGSLALFLRRAWAMWLFGISLACLIISTIYIFGYANGAQIMGQGGVIFTAVIWVIAIGLFVYARAMVKRSVLA